MNAATWGGSTIADLTPLDLVLEHGFKPANAAKETRRTVVFPRNPESNKAELSAIRPSNLTIHEP